MPPEETPQSAPQPENDASLNSGSGQDTPRRGRGGARAGAGRPEYQPSAEDKVKVRLWMYVHTPQEDMAKALGISVVTFKKHFRKEIEIAEMEFRGIVLGAMMK